MERNHALAAHELKLVARLKCFKAQLLPVNKARNQSFVV